MPKPMFVWSGSAWVSVASEVESLAGYATQSYADNIAGMKLVVPTSVAVGSGSGSISTQGTVSFSGASSVSLNGCFSSTYDNYRVIVIGSSTAGSTTFRFRTSGTDNSAASYQRQYLDATSTSVAGNRVTAQTSISSMELQQTANASVLVMDIHSPFLSQPTGLMNMTNLMTTNIYVNLLSGAHTGNTSFDGFSIIQSSGTISGTINVYGYKKG